MGRTVSNMVPIGIVTRDRALYLDITLRSLSQTTLPPGVPLLVFDDGSTAVATQRYYNTSQVIQTETHWPNSPAWKATGLHVISDNYVQPTGIVDLVEVVSLGAKSTGVVNASCQTVCRLFERYPTAPGVILLQDDVIFKEDWYSRLLTTAEQYRQFSDFPLGLLAGIKLNHKITVTGTPLAVPTGITAQCLYISRAAYTTLQASYFKKRHQATKKFDDSLRREVANTSLWAGCIYPFVCQHFGIRSLVRPLKRWEQGSKGRVGYYVRPPFALAEQVKCFKA